MSQGGSSGNHSGNKERWLGAAILLAGGGLLGALLFSGQGQRGLPEPVPAAVSQPTKNNPFNNPADPEQGLVLRPLTMDIDTEKRLLEEQKAARERQVAEQEARTAEFLARQQAAEASAARRTAEEQAARLQARAARLDQAASTDPAAPEPIGTNVAAQEQARRDELARKQAEVKARVDELAASHDQANAKAEQARREAEAARNAHAALQKQLDERERNRQQAAEEQRLQARREAEAERKAEAQRQKEAELAAKRKAEQDEKARLKAEAEAKRKADSDAKAREELRLKAEKARKEAERLEAQIQALEDKKAQASKAADQSASKTTDKATDKATEKKSGLTDAQARDVMNADKPPAAIWTVQAAMAVDQGSADTLVARLRAKGYKVRTSSTTKGVRVLVGAEKDKASASKIRDKIINDDSLGIKGAWVANWQPPTS